MWGQIDDPDSQKSKKLVFTRGNGVFRVFDELEWPKYTPIRLINMF